MDPYSGLFDLFDKKGLLTKSKNSYLYTDNAGEEHKMFKKKWEANQDGILDVVMEDIMEGGQNFSNLTPVLEEDDETIEN